MISPFFDVPLYGQAESAEAEGLSQPFFAVPVSLGTVSNLEQAMSAALVPAHVEA